MHCTYLACILYVWWNCCWLRKSASILIIAHLSVRPSMLGARWMRCCCLCGRGVRFLSMRDTRLSHPLVYSRQQVSRIWEGSIYMIARAGNFVIFILLRQVYGFNFNGPSLQWREGTLQLVVVGTMELLSRYSCVISLAWCGIPAGKWRASAQEAINLVWKKQQLCICM